MPPTTEDMRHWLQVAYDEAMHQLGEAQADLDDILREADELGIELKR